MKRLNESWLHYAQRIATQYNLDDEVTAEYLRCKADGYSDIEAAWAACYEWDIPLITKCQKSVLKDVLKLII